MTKSDLARADYIDGLTVEVIAAKRRMSKQDVKRALLRQPRSRMMLPRRVTVFLTDDASHRVHAEASRTGRSLSDVIRDAVHRQLGAA